MTSPRSLTLGSIATLLFMSAVIAQAQLPQAPPPPPPGLAPAPAPPPPVRTRYFTSLTNLEVERYLQYNDVIFVPIGNAQARGVLPIDCEYVAAEAIALKMAQETNALVFPYLQFTYAGAGIIGRGTVHVSQAEGLAYLKPLARSLLRQGFKRQIYVTAGNNAAPQTVSPLVLEYFYETKTPALYIQADVLLRQVGADITKVMFGAYSIVNRLNDIPVNFTPDVPKHDIDQGLAKLRVLNSSGGARDGVVGFFMFEDDAGAPVKPVTAEQRVTWAKEGAAMIDAAVKRADMRKVVQSLLDHQRFTREYLIAKFDSLPR